MKLSELEKDALREIANIGVSSSATQLSQLLCDDIKLEVPEVELLALQDVPDYIDNTEEDMGIVVQKMSGELTGCAHLVFFSDEQKVLVQALLGTMPSAEDVDMGFFEKEAITEIGNIVISSCIAQFADQLGGEIHLTIPTYSEKKFRDLLDDDPDESHQILLIKTSLTAAKRNVKGFIVILLTLESTVKLVENLSTFIKFHQKQI